MTLHDKHDDWWCECGPEQDKVGDSPTVSEPRTPTGKWLADQLHDDATAFLALTSGRFSIGNTATKVIDAIPIIEAEAAQPIDVDRWVKWVIEVSGVDRLDSLIYDHACAECVPDGPIVIAGFVCVPHAAARLRASDTDQPGEPR